MKTVLNIFLKITLSIVIIVVVALVYIIMVELFGHSLILSLVAPLGLLIIIPLWKGDAQTINGDTVNTVIKSISTTEKFVFILLLLFISTILKATGMSMSFSTTLIFLSILFFIYKRITMKVTSDENQPMPIEKNEVETMKFISNEKKESIFHYFKWWKIDQNELDIQIKNYNSLKINKSSKGIAMLLIVASVVFTSLFVILGVLPIAAHYGAIVYLPLAFFVYKGKKWAMITMMILWTLEKGWSLVELVLNSQVSYFGRFVMILFWWCLFMKYLYSAYIVEKLRSKTSLPPLTQNLKFTPSKFNLKYNTKGMLVMSMILVSIIGIFYWFEVRPSKIRQECSFVTKHIEAIPARPAKTESELLSEGVIKPCSTYEQIYYGQFSNLDKLNIEFCDRRNKILVESYSKPILAEEAKNILEPASKEEYDFCVRSRGLKN